MCYSTLVQWLAAQQEREARAPRPAQTMRPEDRAQEAIPGSEEAVATSECPTPVAIVLDALAAPRPKQAA